MAPEDHTPSDEATVDTTQRSGAPTTQPADAPTTEPADAPTTDSADAAEPTPDAPTESNAAPRKRARRSTRKAAAVAQAPPPAGPLPPDQTRESGPGGPAADADTPEAAEVGDRVEAPSAATHLQAPAKKAARKRAPRKRATAPATSSSEVTEVTEDTQPVEPAEAPVDIKVAEAASAAQVAATEAASGSADTQGTRAPGARADALASEAVVLPEIVAVEVDTAATDVMDASVPAVVSAEVDETDEADEPDEAGAPAGSSFSVLFQPPALPDAAGTRSTRRPTEPVEDAGHREDNDAGAATDARPARSTGDRISDSADADGADSSSDGQDEGPSTRRSRRRRGGKGRRGRSPAEIGTGHEESSAEATGERSGDSGDSNNTDTSGASGSDDAKNADDANGSDGGSDDEAGPSRRRRRRRRGGSSDSSGEARGTNGSSGSARSRASRAQSDEPTAVRGSTRLEAKRQRRREGREAGRRRTIITEAEFLARRESVERVMVVRNKDGRTQMGVLEDGVLVEHYIDQATNVSMAGNIYLGRIQNVLPSMEAAFVDIGKGRNAVLYAGEVNWDAAGLDANQPRRIEQALSSGQPVLVQVTKDPIGHKGARLTSQISLPGRYLVYIPNSQMTGISRKLPEGERARLKKILREVVPSGGGVIVRTAAEGASEDDIRADVERLTATWEDIEARAEAASKARAGKSKGKKHGGGGSSASGSAPMLLHGEPDLTVRVIRDVFNEDFKELVVSGDQAWQEIHPYITTVAPDLADRVTKWTGTQDLFTHHRVDEQIAKAMDRKVWLPSGGSLVIDRTEAMTVVDVNTGKFIGAGGNLEETVTKNNIEAAEELVRQLRLRDIGGIIVVDFIDMVLESNRELVIRRMLECLGRDRTKHQVAEVTSLGLVQMTRKRVGSGLIEVFSETCEHCNGRGFIIHTDPVDQGGEGPSGPGAVRGRRGRRGADSGGPEDSVGTSGYAASQAQPARIPSGPTAAQIAAAAHAAALKRAAAAAAAVPESEAQAPVPTREDAAPAPTSSTEEAVPASAAPGQFESDVPDAVDTASPEPAFTRVEHPRPRRRRGRVVAPAGPPRHVETPAAASGQTGVGSP